jgi:hypothetical protein
MFFIGENFETASNRKGFPDQSLGSSRKGHGFIVLKIVKGSRFKL